MSELNWRTFPAHRPTPLHIRRMVGVFEDVIKRISTPQSQRTSDDVLAILRPGLEAEGWIVESGKKAAQKISRPVLFGERGLVTKSFEVDAFHAESGTVLEVEAGRAVMNHQFLKDLFEGCVIQDCVWLAIAVQNAYNPKSAARPYRDYDTVVSFIETLYASDRLALPLAGVVIVGY